MLVSGILRPSLGMPMCANDPHRESLGLRGGNVRAECAARSLLASEEVSFSSTHLLPRDIFTLVNVASNFLLLLCGLEIPPQPDKRQGHYQVSM